MSDTNTNTALPASPITVKDDTVIIENNSEPLSSSSPSPSSSSPPLSLSLSSSSPPPSSSSSPSKISNENSKEHNTAKLLDTTELIQALATQMQYYFSSKNLAQDTYLNTIMKLNSTFVPITILCGFTNINRIIARYADGIDIADIDVHALLGCSAVQSNVLNIVLLDQDGNVIAAHGSEGYDGMKGPKVFEAIGSCETTVTVTGTGTGTVKGREGSEGTHRQGAAQLKDDAKDSSTGTNSTVILRDVPEEATEEDILSVFRDDDGNVVISGVQKEVGQCWFVTIDASTSQQDLVSILLNLRSKTICNEPIKARLKTQSIAIQGVPMQGSGYNPHRARVYSGDRLSYSRKFNNRPHLKPRSGKGGEYNPGSYKGNNYDASKKVPKPVEKVSPPPPLVEEHFPGLDGGSPNGAGAGAATSDGNEGVKKEFMQASGCGYAAALKKAAPPVTEVSTENVKRSKPKSPARKKVDDSKSTGTVSTEGSTSDDKSHASKETEIVLPSAVKSWGGGRSFADILKKQEA